MPCVYCPGPRQPVRDPRRARSCSRGRGRARPPWACYALEDPAPAGAGARQPWPPGSPGAPRPVAGAVPPGLASDLQQLPPCLGRCRGSSDAARPAWAALGPGPPARVPRRPAWGRSGPCRGAVFPWTGAAFSPGTGPFSRRVFRPRHNGRKKRPCDSMTAPAPPRISARTNNPLYASLISFPIRPIIKNQTQIHRTLFAKMAKN